MKASTPIKLGGIKRKIAPVPPPAALTYMTLNQALRDTHSLSLFVVNLSDKNGRYPRSDIVIDISNGREVKSTLLIIRNTWIPQDLTVFKSREEILASSDFRRAISQHLIEILSDDFAEGLLAAEDAQEELYRLQSTSATANDEEEVKEIEENVQPNVVSLMERDIKPRERMASLRNIEAMLKPADLHYIMVKARANDDKLKLWVKEKIGE